MQVLKFGGTSVANSKNIRNVAAIVKQEVKKGKTIIIVSALGGVTDTLLQCGYWACQGNAEYKVPLHHLLQ